MSENINKTEFNNYSTPEIAHKIGGSALVEATYTAYQLPETQGFDHLLPLSNNNPEHPITAEELLSMAQTPEETARLALTLADNDPYKEYALSYIAEHYIENGELDKAYDIISRLGESAFTVHAFSKLMMYLDDNKLPPIRPGLDQELHNLAINAYNNHPSAETARALGEASEALPSDSEIRHFARAVIQAHPELQPSTEDVDLY
ncbi:MAG TPA: hypothetical protein VFT59_05865 [Candidatus Saccharimonadales bacterium]|nr:hypothetical protein [Candidatus Saccharimonadales bacterium]